LEGFEQTKEFCPVPVDDDFDIKPLCSYTTNPYIAQLDFFERTGRVINKAICPTKGNWELFEMLDWFDPVLPEKEEI